jgi:hypothetical protein
MEYTTALLPEIKAKLGTVFNKAPRNKRCGGITHEMHEQYRTWPPV